MTDDEIRDERWRALAACDDRAFCLADEALSRGADRTQLNQSRALVLADLATARGLLEESDAALLDAIAEAASLRDQLATARVLGVAAARTQDADLFRQIEAFLAAAPA